MSGDPATYDLLVVGGGINGAAIVKTLDPVRMA